MDKQLKELKELERLLSNTLILPVAKKFLDEQISNLKQALTPPTADEIVKEANEYFDNIVWYDEVDKIFMIGEDMLSLDICPIQLAHKITSFFMAMEED